MHEFTLNWSLLIELNGADPEAVKDNLRFIINQANEQGWITGGINVNT